MPDLDTRIALAAAVVLLAVWALVHISRNTEKAVNDTRALLDDEKEGQR